MVHDDETRSAETPPKPPNRPAYWVEKEQRLAVASTGSNQRSPWSVALPVALVMMVALIAFLIIWMLLHHGKNASSSGASTSAPSVSQSKQNLPTASSTTDDSSATSTHSGSTAPGPVTPPKPTTATSTVTSTAVPSETSAGFPGNVIDSCADYLGSPDGYQSKNPNLVSIGDPGVRVESRHGKNSCDFIQDAAQNVRGSMSDGDSAQSFDVPVTSGWRAAHKSTPVIVLSCKASGGLAHCINEEGRVDMYVKR